MERVDCGLDNGRTGDARVALVVCDAREAVPCCQPADAYRPVLAVETNAGPMQVPLNDGCLAMICDEFGVCPNEIRTATVAAFPAASGWDWD